MSDTSIPMFHQYKVLKGHTDSINSLVFSPDGKQLASGGDDGCLFVFNTRTWRTERKYRTVSPVRAVTWHDDYPGAISFGLKTGIVTTVQLKDNLKFEHNVHGTIHCMASDRKLLAVGFNNEVLIARLSSLSSWKSDRHVPRPADVNGIQDITRSLNFHLKEKLIFVTYMFAGIMAYDIEDVAIQRWRIDLRGLCGESALSPTGRLLATTMILGGIYWSDTSKRTVASITEQIQDNVKVQLPIVFISTNTVAVGSPDGQVIICKSGKSRANQVLSHNDDMVQTLAYFHQKHDSSHLLVTGISEMNEDCVLTIWKAQEERKSVWLLNALSWRTLLFGFGALTVGLLVSKYADNIQALVQHDFPVPDWTFWDGMLRKGQEPIFLQDATVTTIYTQIVTHTVEVNVAETVLPITADEM